MTTIHFCVLIMSPDINNLKINNLLEEQKQFICDIIRVLKIKNNCKFLE